MITRDHFYKHGTNSSRDARLVFEILPQDIFFCGRKRLSVENTEQKWTYPKPFIAKAIFMVGQECCDDA